MSISFKSLAIVPDKIHPADEFAVSMDISSWLDSDTIASAVYTAVDGDGDDASSDVLDTDQCSEDTDTVYPYITGGSHDTWYMIKIVVTTAGGDVKTFYLKFHCYDYNYSL